MNGHPAESFSSLPPEEEAQFVVYEERMRTAERSSKMIGMVVAGGFFVLVTAIIIGFWGPIKSLVPPEPTAAPAPAAAPSSPSSSGAAAPARAAPTDSAAAAAPAGSAAASAAPAAAPPASAAAPAPAAPAASSGK